MFLYLFLIFIIIILFSFLKKKQALFISFTLLAFFAGIRKYTVGIDTQQFYDAFTAIGESEDWTFSQFRYEYGFSFLCKVLYLIFRDPQSLIFLSSIFINFSVCVFIKNNSKDYFLSTLLYIFLNYYFNYMNIMRQAIGISIMLLFFRFLRERKYLLYLLGIIIGFLFHMTVIAGLLLIFVKMFSKYRYFNLVIIFCGLIGFVFYKEIFLLGASLLGDYYVAYINSEFAASNYFGSLLLFLEYLAIVGSCIYLFCKTRKENRSVNSKYLVSISLVILCCFAMVMRMNIFNRISSIFEIYLIIFVPNILENYLSPKGVTITRNTLLYSNVKYFCISLTFLFFLGINILRPEWYGTIPYEFFFI